MGWWRFWDKEREHEPPQEAVRVPREQAAWARVDAVRQRPPDMANNRRIAELRRRREVMIFDIEQGELALQPDNPWQERIELLGEAIANVEADLAALDTLPASTVSAVEPVPIVDIVARGEELIQTAFTIGDERFRFEEQVDWDQRGGPTVRGDLQLVSGSVDSLLGSARTVDERVALRDHLSDSIAVFATDLRDRTLSGEPLPAAPTLADLAKPCPTCGGWMDWNGRCPACTSRAIERQRLRVERDRLDGDRRKEADEQHRLADGLVISRRRLAAVETDIISLGVGLD